jgi:LPS-assembly lipoprotein
MRRVLTFGIGMGALGTLLAGCGFTPLYGQPGVTAGLSSIDVVSPPGRVGFLLRQSLDDDLGHNKTAPAQYRLEVTLAQTRGPRGLTRTDVADYYDIGLTAHYTLILVATGKAVATGDVASQVSYDDSGQAYADISAAQDADSRIASDAARRIEIKLAAWMARQPVH